MLFFAHFSKVKETQKKRKRKKGTDPLKSLYIFGVHRFFFTFRSCWNPSGFSDSILKKKKVPTPWNPYTIFGSILKSEKKSLFPILLESFGILWFSFRKEKGTDPLKSLYNFVGGLGKRKKTRKESRFFFKKVPTPWNPYTILGSTDFFLVSDPVGILRDFPIRFWEKKRYRPLGIPIQFWGA